MVKILLSTVLLIMAAHSQAAVIARKPQYEGDCGMRVSFVGDIVKGDLVRLQSVFGQIKECNIKKGFPSHSVGVTLEIDSLGGSVDEAIAVGRFVRSMSMGTEAIYGTKCYSSCALVYAAGVRRRASNNAVGLHRPYFAGLRSGIGYAELFDLRRQVVMGIKRYVEEIDVSVRLVEDMLAIPPDDIRLLTVDELKSYRMFGDDPTFEEKQVAEQANRFGISMLEYRRRDAMSSVCSGREPGGFVACWQSHILQIPLPESKRRNDRFQSFCHTNYGKTERELMSCWKDVVVRGQ